MSDHVLKVRSIGKNLKIIEFQLMVKNETKGFTHNRDSSSNSFKQSPRSTVNEHYYKNIFVDLIKVVPPLVLVGAP